MRKRGWMLFLILLMVAFLVSCGKNTEPDEAKGELVKMEREGTLYGEPSLFPFIVEMVRSPECAIT